MNILFTVNRAYIGHVAECIRSILRFPSADGYDIYILHSDLQDRDQADFLSQIKSQNMTLHFHFVDPSLFSSFPESDRYPRLIYYRIFAASLLPMEVEKILYLDGDTVVINPLDELYNMEFEGNYFLACTHVRKFLNKVNQYRLGVEEEITYINSGVMLMNLRELREKQNIKEVMSFVEKRKRYLTLPDQDIITALYGNKTGILDTMKYNLSDRMLSFYNAKLNHKKIDLDWIRENTVVIHYYGIQKPWKKPYMGILNVFYEELKAEIQDVSEK
ncbi:MAG: glycosyltransferase family 8 protein [Eubacteriales bacterium]|nr:glycosyltransferase family 8 protein [Eubacteriales bacterium]